MPRLENWAKRPQSNKKKKKPPWWDAVCTTAQPGWVLQGSRLCLSPACLLQTQRVWLLSVRPTSHQLPELPLNHGRNRCLFAGAAPRHLLELQGPHQKHTMFEEGRSISLCAVTKICSDSFPGMSCRAAWPAAASPLGSSWLLSPRNGTALSPPPLPVLLLHPELQIPGSQLGSPFLEVCCPGSVSLAAG